MDAQSEQQDTSVGSSQLQSVNEAAQPQYTSFGVCHAAGGPPPQVVRPDQLPRLK